MAKELTYSEAEAELDEIIKSIEDEEIDIDELTSKIRRACELLKFCNAKLKKTDDEVKKILEEFGKETEMGNEKEDDKE